MRIAWVGAAPNDGGGVPYCAATLISGLASRGVEVDCFVTGRHEEIAPHVREDPKIRCFLQDPSWSWNRWYSRDPVAAFITGQSARAIAQSRLARTLLDHHRQRPYDLVYQFSQIESFGLRRMRRSLPPLIVHPEVHAAGELRWHKLESSLARRCESRSRSAAVRTMLAARAAVQERHLRSAAKVICPSSRFADLLTEDYRLKRDRIEVVPNPIDLTRITPDDDRREPDNPRVLFVSRISVRKGVEDVVWLSHRLADTGAALEIVGGGSLWSDYRPLLRDLNPQVARYDGELTPEEVCGRFRAATVTIQPSRYEPFGLTVAEAMAAGTPVVTSDQVGASEFVNGPSCLRYPFGDRAALESSVRRMIARARSDPASLRREARSQAQRAFAAGPVADDLLSRLGRVVAQGTK